jgi:hypothetical protein
MRSLALLFGALLLGITAVAWADSLTDLRRPLHDPRLRQWLVAARHGSGIAEPTCEGNAARAGWNKHAVAISTARDTLAKAGNRPDKAAPRAVIDALDACAAAADAMTRLYHPISAAPHDDAAVVAWMRNWLAPSKLPILVTIGDGFRALAAGLAQPGLRRHERNALYGEAAIFASRESTLAAARGAEVERRTDDAVRAAHSTALKAAANAEAGLPQQNATAAITAAAGPGHPSLAQRQTTQLARSLAAHPDQVDIRRGPAAIPDALRSRRWP